MTNREYINKLSNEELANYIYDVIVPLGSTYTISRVGIGEWLSKCRTCWNCDKTDGCYYTSNPPMVRCSVTGKYHYLGDKCDLEEIK